MKKILHMSDVHFDKIDSAMIAALLRITKRIHPTLIIISGDLTQRAKVAEFEAVAQFIHSLKKTKIPVFAIPGNHDIAPFYAPVRRMINAYDRYNDAIVPLTVQRYADSEIAVLGINTVRRSRIKDGRISRSDIEKAKDWFGAHPRAHTRIVVTHHPLDLPSQYKKHKLVIGSKRAIYALADAHVDVYLSGHHHRHTISTTAVRYTIPHHNAITVQAGTVSTRSRGEAQSFNLLVIKKNKIEITTYIWNSDQSDFVLQPMHAFIRDNTI